MQVVDPTTNSASLEEYCNNFFISWKLLFGEQKYQACYDLSKSVIDILKPLYRNRLYGESPEAVEGYNFAYLFLILAKSLEDLIELVDLTKDGTWTNDNKLVEVIWDKLWDAKERLDKFKSHCTEGGVLDGIYDQLEKLESDFREIFGSGIYMSPVLLIKSAECTICGKNIKACSHIPGNLYDGISCKEKVVDFELHGADIVQSPFDMRCRIWPWNFTKEMTFQARLHSLGSIDDFITH